MPITYHNGYLRYSCLHVAWHIISYRSIAYRSIAYDATHHHTHNQAYTVPCYAICYAICYAMCHMPYAICYAMLRYHAHAGWAGTSQGLSVTLQLGSRGSPAAVAPRREVPHRQLSQRAGLHEIEAGGCRMLPYPRRWRRWPRTGVAHTRESVYTVAHYGHRYWSYTPLNPALTPRIAPWHGTYASTKSCCSCTGRCSNSDLGAGVDSLLPCGSTAGPSCRVAGRVAHVLQTY